MDRSPFSVAIVTSVPKNIFLIISANKELRIWQRNTFFLGIVYQTFTERTFRHELFRRHEFSNRPEKQTQ